MKKIAILTCLHSNGVCTGAACLRALNERKGAFAAYAGEEIELTAFLRCNGCGCTLENDPGLREKADRLLTEGTEIVHLGLCTRDSTGKECETIRSLAAYLEERGILICRGTHGSRTGPR